MPESWSTDFVKDLVRLQAEAAADDSFWISVVPPKIAMTGVGVDRLSRQQRVLAVHNVHKEDLAGDQALSRAALASSPRWEASLLGWERP